MAEALKRARLVHITTAPAALWAFFVGQIGYMKAWGFEVHAISSPEETLDRFARREQIPVCAVAMSRSVTPLRIWWRSRDCGDVCDGCARRSCTLTRPRRDCSVWWPPG